MAERLTVVKDLTDAQQLDRESYLVHAPQTARNLLEHHVVEGGRMVSLPHEPSNPLYPGQDPRCFAIDTKPMPLHIADGYATLADPNFPEMEKMAAEGREAEEIIDSSYEILKGDGNVWVATWHLGDINDVAYGGKIHNNNLASRHEGFRPKETLIVVSRMIPEAGYLMENEGDMVPVSMVYVLQTGFTRIVLPWPKTSSSEEELEKLPEAEIKRHNDASKDAINEPLEAGGVAGALAPSGSTRDSTISDATIGLVARPKTYVLPMIVWRHSEKPVVRYCSEPVQIDPKHPGQMDDLMGDIAERMNHAIPGENFDYEAPPERKLGRAALQNSETD
jgi:hypothetical protein